MDIRRIKKPDKEHVKKIDDYFSAKMDKIYRLCTTIARLKVYIISEKRTLSYYKHKSYFRNKENLEYLMLFDVDFHRHCKRTIKDLGEEIKFIETELEELHQEIDEFEL